MRIFKENINSKTMHKFAFSNKVINLNEKIKKSDLIFLRTNLIDGINRLDLEKNEPNMKNSLFDLLMYIISGIFIIYLLDIFIKAIVYSKSTK